MTAPPTDPPLEPPPGDAAPPGRGERHGHHLPHPHLPGRGHRQPRTLRYHGTAGARPMAAGHVVLVGLIAFSLAALLNADSLYALANRQPYGPKRSIATGIMRPIRWVSHTTGLSKPREWLVTVQGRDPDAGTGSSEFTVPTTEPPPPDVRAVALRVPTAAQPMAVWVGGDSMAQEIGGSLVAELDRREVFTTTEDARISTGLTRPDYFPWYEHFRDSVLPTAPEVMVVIFGANDAQPMEVDGTPYQVRTPEWQAEYRKRVGATMDLLAGDGRLIVWLGQPSMRKAEFSERMDILNRIYAEEAEGRPWIRWVPLAPMLAPEGGGYSDYVTAADGSQERARQADGIHLSRYGADLVARNVADEIEAAIDEFSGPNGATGPAASGATTTTTTAAGAGGDG